MYSVDITLRHSTDLLALVKDMGYVSEGMVNMVVKEVDGETKTLGFGLG